MRDAAIRPGFDGTGFQTPVFHCCLFQRPQLRFTHRCPFLLCSAARATAGGTRLLVRKALPPHPSLRLGRAGGSYHTRSWFLFSELQHPNAPTFEGESRCCLGDSVLGFPAFPALGTHSCFEPCSLASAAHILSFVIHNRGKRLPAVLLIPYIFLRNAGVAVGNCKRSARKGTA